MRATSLLLDVHFYVTIMCFKDLEMTILFSFIIVRFWFFIYLRIYLFTYLIDLLIYLFIYFLQNWMAFTKLRVDNFTITDSLVFTNSNSPSDKDNYAFCQVRI